jgi:hypothetical protein
MLPGRSHCQWPTTQLAEYPRQAGVQQAYDKAQPYLEWLHVALRCRVVSKARLLRATLMPGVSP